MNTSVITAYRINSPAFVRAYIVTMRPYLLFLSGITGVAGMAFVYDVAPLRAILIGLASFCSYGFGQALTDCFQLDTDRISSPYRPLTQGLVTPIQVFVVSVIGLLVCVGIMGVYHPTNILLGILAGAGLATYTPFKRRWWGGPWYNAWIVGVLFMIGFLAGSGVVDVVLPAAAVWTLVAVVLGYANFVLSGYFKDIEADSQAGYFTLPVVFGRGVSSRVSDVLAFTASAALIIARLSINPILTISFPVLSSWIMISASTVISFRAQQLLHRVRHDDEAHAPIVLVVHTYILGLAGIVAAVQPGWILPLTLFYGLFVLTLNARPSRTQI